MGVGLAVHLACPAECETARAPLLGAAALEEKSRPLTTCIAQQNPGPALCLVLSCLQRVLCFSSHCRVLRRVTPPRACCQYQVCVSAVPEAACSVQHLEKAPTDKNASYRPSIHTANEQHLYTSPYSLSLSLCRAPGSLSQPLAASRPLDPLTAIAAAAAAATAPARRPLPCSPSRRRWCCRWRV